MRLPAVRCVAPGKVSITAFERYQPVRGTP